MFTLRLIGGIFIVLLLKKLFDKRTDHASANGKNDTSATQKSESDSSSSSSLPSSGENDAAAASLSSATQECDDSSSSGWDYEVFLSFRGEDTRTNFTDHLYNALLDKGIHTFRDNEGLHIGENIGPALRSAIHRSKIAIIIFSKDYASSKWCLLELAEIAGRMKECPRQMKVMPVFYHVVPSDVRNQTPGSSYGNAFRNHEKKFNKETVQGWKKTLREVGELKGWDPENIAEGHEGELIKLIVNEVWSELRKCPLTISDNMVGIHSHIKEMMKLLNITSKDRRIIGIHGLGGIGKTTIAKCVYNTVYHHFEGCSFIADSRETFQTKGAVHLQGQLLTNILNLENPNITSVDQGIDMIKQRLSNKKVLIVLDDVDQNTDLKAIIGKRDWFGFGSRIIITTRDRHILDLLEVDGPYEPNDMDSNQSLKLFSKHAFKMDSPPKNYLELSKDVVKTTGGLPLALEVIGSSLFGREELAWKDTVKKLAKIPDNAVQKKLRISYDGLSYEEKEIFLDIACFFIGTDKNIACYIWDGCGFFPRDGIDKLCLNALVKIDENDELRMHDQLRDLGREIVRQENFKEPAERSRLWLYEEVLEVLSTQQGTRKVEGLSITIPYWGNNQCIMIESLAAMTKLRLLQVDYAKLMMPDQLRDLGIEIVRQENPKVVGKRSRLWSHEGVLEVLSTQQGTRKVEGLSITFPYRGNNQCMMIESFAAMTKLRLLQVDNVTVAGNLVLSFPEMRWLSWKRCPMQFTPTSLRRLCVLDLSESDITENWMGWNYIKEAKSLRVLNLSRCCKLSQTPDFSENTQLEVLVFKGCRNLATIDASIGHLKRLVKLNLSHCYELSRIPDLSENIQLEVLVLENCKKLVTIEASIGHLKKLVILNMNECKSLMLHLPASIGELTSLKILDIRNVKIDQLPETLGRLEALTELYVDFSAIRLPSSVHQLRNLQILSTDHYCMKHEDTIRREYQNKPRMGLEMDLPDLPPSLRYLDASLCEMRSLPMLSNLTNLVVLQLYDCPNLMEIPTAINALTSLESLGLDQCPRLECIPHLPSGLKSLIVHNCQNLREISGYLDMGNLEKLRLRYCSKLAKLSLEGLHSLQQFEIWGCDSLRKLPKLRGLRKLRCLEFISVGLSEIEVLEGLYSLEKLNITYCELLRTIPNLSDSKNLECIEIQQCNELSEIEGLKGLDSLEKLSISGCPSLKKMQLPKKLCELYISRCDKLSEIEIEGPEDLECLTIFHICWCKSIVRLPDLSNLKMLKDLGFKHLPLEINCFEGLESLEELCLFGSKSLKVLPDISPLKNLKHLSLSDCENLIEIPSVGGLVSLETLYVRRCKSIEILPDVSNLTKLQVLKIEGCEKVTEIHGVDRLQTLEVLSIDGCISIERLPCLSNLKNLTRLSANNCEKLIKIQGVDELESLESFCILGCISIETLPCLSKLKKLSCLYTSGCKKLTEIQGVDELESLKFFDVHGCISMQLPDFKLQV